MLGIIEEAGGDLLVFGGDALLVLFAETGHAPAAVQAAVQLQEAMAAPRVHIEPFTPEILFMQVRDFGAWTLEQLADLRAFGYDVRDINAADFIGIDHPPGRVYAPGEMFRADVFSSHMSQRNVQGAVLNWRLDVVSPTGERDAALHGSQTFLLHIAKAKRALVR